jgi:hypothetical protein
VFPRIPAHRLDAVPAARVGVKFGIQPSPSRATRRIAASEMPHRALDGQQVDPAVLDPVELSLVGDERPLALGGAQVTITGR